MFLKRSQQCKAWECEDVSVRLLVSLNKRRLRILFWKRVTVCTSARREGQTRMSASLSLTCKQLCSLDWNWCTVEYLIFNLLLQQPVEQKHTGARRKQVGSSHQLGWRPFKTRTKWNLIMLTFSKPLKTYNYLSVWLCVVVWMVTVLYTWSGSELLSCVMHGLQPEGKHLARTHRKPDQQTTRASATAVMCICTTVMAVQIWSAQLSHT